MRNSYTTPVQRVLVQSAGTAQSWLDFCLASRMTSFSASVGRLQTVVDEANESVSRAESIRRFRVLPVDLTEQNGYLTPTLKVKRALVHKDFAAEIDELYH
jgi:long-subunit acyl-CoA synthetase (AMP-forming)